MAKYRLGTTTVVADLELEGETTFESIFVSGEAEFGDNIVVDGYRIDISAGAEIGQGLIYDGSVFKASSGGGSVSDVSNSDDTLTISPTTGSVVASLNLDHANTWTQKQSFVSHIAIDGYDFDLSGPVEDGYVLRYNEANTAFEPARISTGVDKKSNVSDAIIDTTDPVDVISFTPETQGNFILYVFYRVENGTTDITIDATWEDMSGASSSNIVPIETSTLVGSYVAAQVYINATTGEPINLTITAGTANNVYVSATLIGIS